MFNNPHLRMMSEVTRWCIVPMHTKRSIADHSYFVMVYALALMDVLQACPLHKMRMVQLVLRHDVPEIETGDLPGPSKRQFADALRLEAFEERVLAKNGFPPFDATGLEHCVLKAADYMDASWEIAWEIAKGNRLVVNLLDQELERVDYWLSKANETTGREYHDALADVWRIFSTTVRRFAALPEIEWVSDPK